MKIPNLVFKNLNEVPSLIGIGDSKEVIENLPVTSAPTKSNKKIIKNLVLKNLDEIDKLPSLISGISASNIEPIGPSNLFLEKIKEINEEKKAEESKKTSVKEGTLDLFSQALDITNTNIISKISSKPKPASTIVASSSTPPVVMSPVTETESSSFAVKNEALGVKLPNLKKLKN